MIQFLFEHLKILDISFCKFTGNASTLPSTISSKLEYLCIFLFEGFNFDFVAMEFPHLVQVHFFGFDLHNFESFRNFLTLNPQLKRLKTNVDVRYFSDIPQFAKNLKQFEIHYFKITSSAQSESDLFPSNKLTKLNELTLHGISIEGHTLAPLMTAYLSENVTLEYLNLCNFCLINSNDIKTIVKIKTLRVLQLATIESIVLIVIQAMIAYLLPLNCHCSRNWS